MPNKDWFDAYMEYKLSTGEENEEKPASDSGCFSWVIGVIIFLAAFLNLFK